METNQPYRTWRRSRGNRLPANCYAKGRPIHVTINAFGDTAPFEHPEHAAQVFRLVANHAETIAACLMPDHLHWLQRDAAGVVKTVQGFKSYSTRVLQRAGWRGPVWQRSFWDHVIRRRESLTAVVEYILANPVRKRLARAWDEYPYSVVRAERMGSG
jgi:REP element-mobilizing transposase RayT